MLGKAPFFFIFFLITIFLYGEDAKEEISSLATFLNQEIEGPSPLKDPQITLPNNIKKKFLENPEELKKEVETFKLSSQKKRTPFLFFAIFTLIAIFAYSFKKTLSQIIHRLIEKKPEDPKLLLRKKIQAISKENLNSTQKTLKLEDAFSHYLEEVYGLNVRTKNTEELIENFKKFSPSFRDNLTEFFTFLEKIKFANMEASDGNFKRLREIAESF